MRRRKWVILSRGVSSTPSPRSDADRDFGVRVWGHGTKGQLGVPKEKASGAGPCLVARFGFDDRTGSISEIKRAKDAPKRRRALESEIRTQHEPYTHTHTHGIWP